MRIWLVLCLYLLASTSGLILFKAGTRLTEAELSLLEGVFQLRINLLSLLGMGLYVLSFFLYLWLVSSSALSRIYPISSGALYVLVYLGGIVFFHESVTLSGVIGGLLILSGVLIISLAGIG